MGLFLHTCKRKSTNPCRVFFSLLFSLRFCNLLSMDIYQSFLVAMEKERQNGNLTRLAKLSGIDISTLWRWANKKSIPTLDKLAILVPFIEWSPWVVENDVYKNERETAQLQRRCDELTAELEQYKRRMAVLSELTMINKPLPAQQTEIC